MRKVTNLARVDSVIENPATHACWSTWFRVLRFGVQGVGLRVQWTGFRAQGSWFRDQELGLSVEG